MMFSFITLKKPPPDLGPQNTIDAKHLVCICLTMHYALEKDDFYAKRPTKTDMDFLSF